MLTAITSFRSGLVALTDMWPSLDVASGRASTRPAQTGLTSANGRTGPASGVLDAEPPTCDDVLVHYMPDATHV